ncbi:MAG: PEP-CTERM sorting domain-containing protein [Rhodobacterales bacterium]|nr:PEP-CTERM sorting domain-containing protein [Rhodobacterales bacterium]
MFKRLTLAAIGAFGLMTASANAAIIGLYQYDANIDGVVSFDIGFTDPVPGQMDISSFDTLTGLGDIKVTVGGSGSHYVGILFDLEIDEAINTYFNENGEAINVGSLLPGQSWEIDEPGFLFGDIATNFDNMALDNSNGVPPGLEDDVSVALAFDFTLGVDQVAVIMFSVSESAPNGGFYIAHNDPDSDATVYYYSTVSIRDIQVPAPGGLALLGLGLIAAGYLRRRHNG